MFNCFIFRFFSCLTSLAQAFSVILNRRGRQLARITVWFLIKKRKCSIFHHEVLPSMRCSQRIFYHIKNVGLSSLRIFVMSLDVGFDQIFFCVYWNDYTFLPSHSFIVYKLIDFQMFNQSHISRITQLCNAVLNLLLLLLFRIFTSTLMDEKQLFSLLQWSRQVLILKLCWPHRVNWDAFFLLHRI